MADFSFKPSFPLATVIDAAQRKAQLEQQAQQQGTQSLVQGLQTIGLAGQSLFDLKRRTAMALAQANTLAQNPEVQGLITGGDVPVASGPKGPVALNQTAQGGEGLVPQQNAPNVPAETIFGLMQSGAQPLDILKQAFDRKTKMAPVNDVIAKKDADGNILGYTEVPRSKGGETIVTGPQNQGPSPRSNLADERTRQLAAAKVKEKAMTEIDKVDTGLQQIESLFNKHKSLALKGKAGGPIVGNVNTLVANVTGGKLGTEEVKAFIDIRDSMVAKLKQVTGDTGVLTEQDAQRIIRLLSSLSEDPKAAKIKFTEIKSILNSSKTRYRSKANTLAQEIQSGNPISEIPDTSAGLVPNDPLGIR